MNILLHEYGMKELSNPSLTSLFQSIYQQKVLQHQIILEETDISIVYSNKQIIQIKSYPKS